ncbi:MAG: nicotinamide riboside transporter PnuC [Parabacteroides sp.]
MNYELALEYFGVVTGLLYLLLEVKQHRAMWVVGFLTSLVYVFVFFSAKIYADMTLNLYYVGISIYGFWQWSRQWKRGETPVDNPAESSSVILYKHLTLKLFTGIMGMLITIYAAIYYLLAHYTDSPIPAGDAFTTAVGIVATWMLARRIIEHWIFWVIVNFVSVYLYYLRGLYPTLFLYTCYGVLAGVGYFIWKKKGTVADEHAI